MLRQSQRCIRFLAYLVLVLIAMPVKSETTDYTQVPLSELIELDVYAPSVLRSHLHEKGAWMLGYEYITMSMEGSLEGTDRVSNQDVLQQFMVTPTRMSMEVHMLHLMYAPTGNLTLMVMFRYLDNSMQHLTRANETFETRSSGMGDVGVSINHVLSEVETANAVRRFALTYGISLPTGSIDNEDFLPAIMANARLPYPMQLGSGTYDPSIGVLYSGYNAKNYWGTQVIATMRIGQNDNGYRLGNLVELQTWVSRAWTDSLATSVKLSASHVENIHGDDPALNPMMIPTADPGRRTKTSVNLHLGLEFNIGGRRSVDHKISLAFTRPIYQNVDGPQLESEGTARVGWQILF